MGLHVPPAANPCAQALRDASRTRSCFVARLGGICGDSLTNPRSTLPMPQCAQISRKSPTGAMSEISDAVEDMFCEIFEAEGEDPADLVKRLALQVRERFPGLFADEGALRGACYVLLRACLEID